MSDILNINDNGTTESLKTELTTGKGFQPIGVYISDYNEKPFEGFINGNNKTIANLYENSESYYYAGLFGVTNNAKIFNLIIKDANIIGYSAAGTLIGSCNGSLRLSKINVNGLTGAKNHVGGIIGLLNINAEVEIRETTNLVNNN